MSRRIDSDEEYERRKRLLEEHEEREARQTGKDLIGGLVSAIGDVTGISNAFVEKITRAVKRETH